MSDDVVSQGDAASSKTEAQRRGNRVVMMWIAVMVAVILGIFIAGRVNDARAQDRRTDEYYCTLSGISPLDRAPNTGRLCADLLSDS